MPFTKKEDRQAMHVADSEMAKGMEAGKAKGIGFAVANKNKKKKKTKKIKKPLTPEQLNVFKKMGVKPSN